MNPRVYRFAASATNAGFADSGGVYAALCSPLFVQADLVGDHRDELTIRGFAAEVVDGVTEVAVQSVHIAAVPGDLDGMADSTFDAAGRGTVALGDFRVGDSLVTALMYSWSAVVSRMASRRNW